MATFNILSNPSETLMVRIEPGVRELVRLNIPTFANVTKVGIPGTQVRRVVNLGGADAEGELSTSNVTTFTEDKTALAYYDLANYRIRSSFQISAAEYAQAVESARSGFPETYFNLLLYKSEAAQREILRKLGQVLFTGTGNTASGGVVGLEATIASVAAGLSDVAYAGIDPTVAGNELWTSRVEDAVGQLTTMGLAAFETDIRSGQTLGSPTSYDILITNPNTALYMKELGLFTNTINQDYTQPSDVGFRGLTYGGRPVIEDPNATPGMIHFVDTAMIQYYFVDQEAGGIFGEEQRINDVPMYISMLPNTNPERVDLALYTKAQVVLHRHGLSTMKGVTQPVKECLNICPTDET